MYADRLGRFVKGASFSIEGFDIIKGFLLVAVVVAIFKYLIPLGLPPSIGYFFGGCFIFILILKIIGFLKLLFTKLHADSAQGSKDAILVGRGHSVSPNEKLEANILGIMRTGSFGDGWIFFGTGNLPHPENAILITDKHLLFVYIPFAGGDKVLGGTNMQITDWLFSTKDLDGKLRDALSQQSLIEFFQSHPKNFAVKHEDIQGVQFKDSKQGIVLDVAGQGKLQYSIRSKEEYDKAKNVLRA